MAAKAGTIQAIYVSDDYLPARHADISVRDSHRGGEQSEYICVLPEDAMEHYIEQMKTKYKFSFCRVLAVRGMNLKRLPLGTRLRCGEALFEIAPAPDQRDLVLPEEGAMARILVEGFVAAGYSLHPLVPRKNPLRAAFVVIGDKGYDRTRAIDKSSLLLHSILEAAGYQIVEQAALPDDRERIEAMLIDLADNKGVDLVLTSGGTGISPEDVTPEATLAVADRGAPGIAEAMRAHAMELTSRAMLSRAVSVIRGRTLIVNLPGSARAVRESLGYILPDLERAVQMLVGKAPPHTPRT